MGLLPLPNIYLTISGPDLSSSRPRFKRSSPDLGTVIESRNLRNLSPTKIEN